MEWETLLYIIPYLISVAISGGVGIYAYRRRNMVVAALPFAVASLAQAFWTLGYIFELVSPSFEAKIFWDNIQWLPLFIIPVAWLVFAFEYTQIKLPRPKYLWISLFGISAIFLLLIFTDDYHHLIRLSPRLVINDPFSVLVYDFALIFWIITLFVYLVLIGAIAILTLRLFQTQGIYRAQTLVILIGMLLPTVGQILTIGGLVPTITRDTTPFTFALGNLIVAWGLFRYRLFDVVPLARNIIVEQMADAVVVLDTQNRVVDINHAAKALLPDFAQNVIGQRAIEVFAEWQYVVEKFRDTTDMQTEIFVDGTGGRRYFEIKVSSLRNRRQVPAGRIFVVRDITNRKLVEEELKQHRHHLEELVDERTAALETANEQLRQEMAQREHLEDQARQSQKMEAVGQLAGGVAHDFNNLLTSIIGHTHLLLDTHSSVDDPINADLQQIKKAADKAAMLTRQLLTFSRKQVFQPKVINLNDIVQDMETLLRRLINETITFKTTLKPDIGTIKVDPGQLQQVIMNLVLNARDAMPRGGVLTIETNNIRLGQTDSLPYVNIEPGFYVTLSVSDTGIGIDKDIQKRIFEPFFTTKEVGEGTGLGLATVHGIVKQSNGDITVRSQPGQGTTFTVYLPQVDLPTDQLPPHVETPQLDYGSETILLVEDEGFVRDLTQRILADLGYQVITASHADEALLVVEQNQLSFNLLITDVVMPGSMNGVELARELCQRRPDIEVLYISGYASDAMTRHEFLDQNANFLQKPFTPVLLAQKVRQVLDRKENS